MKSFVKLIKKSARESFKKPAAKPLKNENRWSRAVQSWVQEFQKTRRERRPSFDRVTKDVVE